MVARALAPHLDLALITVGHLTPEGCLAWRKRRGLGVAFAAPRLTRPL